MNGESMSVAGFVEHAERRFGEISLDQHCRQYERFNLSMRGETSLKALTACLRFLRRMLSRFSSVSDAEDS